MKTVKIKSISIRTETISAVKEYMVATGERSFSETVEKLILKGLKN